MSSNGVRQRAGKGSTKTPSTGPNSSKQAPEGAGFGVVDVIRMLGGIAVMAAALSYFVTSGESFVWNQKMPWWTKPQLVKQQFKGPLKLTLEQLKQYDGTDPSKPIYIAVNRTIYDVSASPQTYGPGGSYHVLTGKDASRAYITGCMDTDLIPDLRGVEEMYITLFLSRHPEPEELAALKPLSEGAAGGAAGEAMKAMKGKSGEEILQLLVEKIGGDRVEEMRDAAYERAHAECRAVIDNWKKMFDGSGGKDYFEAGRVVAEDGGELLDESFGPRPKLCKLARDKRPKMMDGLGGGAKGGSFGGKDPKRKVRGALPTEN